MDIGPIMEVFIICQSQKMSISSRKGEIHRLHHLPLGHPNRKRANQGRTELA